MTTLKEITAVGIRLEEAATRLGSNTGTPDEIYERYLMISIQILDSEFDQYPDDALEMFLRDFLENKRRDLKLD